LNNIDGNVKSQNKIECINNEDYYPNSNLILENNLSTKAKQIKLAKLKLHF